MTTEDSGTHSAPAPTTAIISDNKCENPAATSDSLSSQRVFKKSSPNNKLTLYLSSRDLVVSSAGIDKLQGVLLVDPEFVETRKVYGQVTLTFRYGREDEEVMGLKFCNEAIMCLAQLYPPHPTAQTPEGNSPLQDALLKRLGPNAYPFSMEITPLAPPSVQLVPAKEYNGAPIGTSYDIRAYVAEKADEKTHRRTTVRMGIRVVQRAFAPPSPNEYVPGGGGKTGKERAKQNRKALLFGCKSSPLEVNFVKDTQNKSRSVEIVSGSEQHHNKQMNEEKATDGSCCDTANKDKKPLDRLQIDTDGSDTQAKASEPSPKQTHVSFREKITNGIDNECELGDKISSKDENLPPHDDDDDDKSISKDCNDEEDDNEDSGANLEKEIGEKFRSLCGGKRPSLAAYLAGVPPPRANVEKPFLLSDGRVSLAASLDKAIYSHGEEIHVSVQIHNNSSKTVRRIKVFIVQHVDVCMFSNGKFKNVVALINTKDDCPLTAGSHLDKTFTLLPIKSSTKNWIALEDSYTKAGTSLASTVTTTANNADDRNVFAIYVSYYVKIKLLVSVMGGEVALKLPFTLMHTCSDYEHTETLTRVERATKASMQLELSANLPETIKPEKDGT